jgi:PmbA protein
MSACEKALSHAKNLNIEECEAIFSQRKIITVRITDSEIAEIKQNQEKTLGVRVINKKRISSAQTSNLEEIPHIVEQALSSSELPKPKEYWDGLPHEFKKTVSVDGLYDKKLADISGSKAVEISQIMIDSAAHQKISSITGSLNIVSEEIGIQNTNGLQCSDKATYISGTINADSKEGFPVSGIGQASGRTLEGFSAESVGEDAKKMCVDSINPQNCDAGEYSIIFDPYSVGELLAFVFASNFNLKTYSEKRSCFSDKLEQKVAVDSFSLMDDPHAKEGIGSKIFDDEGVATKPRPLIENGIFKNTYSDLFQAFKEGEKTSANASRPGSPMGRSSEPIPFPAPHNLRIKSNGTSRDEIIKETKKGLIVGRLWYTYAVNPIKGDFSCTARSGIQVVEDGKIQNPGKPVRIVHNLSVLLQNISAIADDEKNVLQWASLPSITPTIRVDGIKVIPI